MKEGEQAQPRVESFGFQIQDGRITSLDASTLNHPLSSLLGLGQPHQGAVNSGTHGSDNNQATQNADANGSQGLGGTQVDNDLRASLQEMSSLMQSFGGG